MCISNYYGINVQITASQYNGTHSIDYETRPIILDTEEQSVVFILPKPWTLYVNLTTYPFHFHIRVI